jgi:DNA repair protein SbcD/Mre11
MTTFRFLHTGDIHLDSPLKGLAGQDGAAAERIRGATRQALTRLIDAALEEEVAFVVIAGDLYDGDWRDYQTGLYFIKEMARLARAGIPVFVAHGNHDAESQITRQLALPDNVQVFPTRKPGTFTLEALGVALHGQGFRQRGVTDNLALGYPVPVAGLFNIGVLHTGLGGMNGHANYAPCSLGDLVNRGYDYWALGHVHQAQVLHAHPHVAFCGNLQGRHIREAGPKGAILVSVVDGAVQALTTIAADVVRWAQVRVAAGGVGHIDDLIDAMRSGIESAVADHAEGRLLACRVELTGESELHHEILGSRERLLAEARAVALALGDEVAWIETVKVRTAPVAVPKAAQADLLRELHTMVIEGWADPDLRRQLDADIGELIRKLPHDVKAGADEGFLKAAVDGNHALMVALASDYLAARLARGA